MTGLMNAPTGPTAPPLDACTRCSGPLVADQRWCLNCGTRRNGVESPFVTRSPVPVPVAAAVTSAPPALAPTERVPHWLQAVLGLAVAAMLFAVGLVVGLAGQDRRTLVTVPPGKPPVVNVDVQGGAPVAAPADGSLTTLVSDWPADTDGWTVQLQALPGSSDATTVDAAKADAEAQGAQDIGALISDDYASLPPDKVIVYSGVFDDKAAAQKALDGLGKDFKDAKVVQVSETGDTGPPPETISGEELDAQENLTGEAQQDASEKLPDEIGTEGKAPPPDDVAPGGGTEGAQIG